MTANMSEDAEKKKFYCSSLFKYLQVIHHFIRVDRSQFKGLPLEKDALQIVTESLS